MENFKYLLIIGGGGTLGSAIVKVFKNSSNWKICSIDCVENSQADKNIKLEQDAKYKEDLIIKLSTEIEEFSKSYQAILNVATGWVKGSIKNIDIFKQTEEMMSKNFYSSLMSKFIFYISLAAHFASKFLSEGGLLIFTGAAKVFINSDPSKMIINYKI
jgi:hypothetical protein